MAQTLAVLFGVGLLAAAIGFARHVVTRAAEQGKLPVPKTPASGRPAAVKGKNTRAQVQRARNARTRAANTRAARTVRVIWAEALATNWLARREHRRAHPRPPRRKLLERLVNPRGGVLPASVTTGTSPSPVAPSAAPQLPPAPAPTTAAPAAPPGANGRHLSPVPDPAPTTHGGPTMPTTGTGAAADFFSAITAVTGRAKAGGIRDKATAIKTLTTGLEQQAAALEEFARHMAEPGQEYPAMVFEPLDQMAAHLRAAAMSGGEADSGLATLMHMPVGELAASSVRAPHNSELNTA